MTKRMIAYCRVSTDDQADKGYSLPSQLQNILRYAETHDCVVVAQFADDYSGATPLSERPEGKKVVAMLHRKEADGLIVHHVDRLSRNLVDALTVVRDMTRRGLEIHVVDMGRIGNETDITLVIKAWQAGDERQKIIERTSRGRNTKANSGKVVGSGLAPFGYHYQDGGFVIDEEQASIVRLIYQWYTQGDGDSVPLGAFVIAKRLTENGIKPAGKANRSGEWSTTQVRNILSNTTYAGTWYYGKKIGRSGTYGRRHASEQIAVSVAPIVSLEVWQAAQEQRDYNVKMSKRNCQTDYLLRGMIRCSCGRAMSGRNGSRYYGYRCTSQINRITIDDRTCRQKNISGRIIETKVWDWVLGIITNPASLEENLKHARRAAMEAAEPSQNELGHVVAMITQAEVELDETLALMKGLPPDGLRYRRLEAESAEIEARHRELTKRKETLEQAIQHNVIALKDIADAVKFRKGTELGLSQATRQDKRRWLEMLRTTVEVKGNTATVRCMLPIEPGVIDLTTF